jgi:hypothetical protein
MRPTHTSLFSFGYSYGGHSPPKPSAWLFLLGTTDCGDLRELVQSWLTPAQLTTNQLYKGYSISERLYTIRRRDQSPCEILLTPHKPSINPMFRIENSPPPTRIKVDGKPLDQEQCPTQMLSQDSLLVLIKGRFDQPVRIEIS